MVVGFISRCSGQSLIWYCLFHVQPVNAPLGSPQQVKEVLMKGPSWDVRFVEVEVSTRYRCSTAVWTRGGCYQLKAYEIHELKGGFAM
jgi:hypothetical protein